MNPTVPMDQDVYYIIGESNMTCMPGLVGIQANTDYIAVDGKADADGSKSHSIKK
ncbi:hypothetical protein DPMN_044487 [Dreissena polymorpha]|uniref:Uncharacterized protein n=1 Tax=Dreissena polymorpha TaxID=45954 RepID=A0A9D4HYS6_DREPO|nr:hypothetical protein DPMN_044487 [Dreissena polymorpha]